MARSWLFTIHLLRSVLFWKSEFPIFSFMNIIGSWPRRLRVFHFCSHSCSDFSATGPFYYSLSFRIIGPRTRCYLNVLSILYAWNCYSSFSVIFQLIGARSRSITFIHFASWSCSYFNNTFFGIVCTIISSWPWCKRILDKFPFCFSNFSAWHGTFWYILILTWAWQHWKNSKCLISFLSQSHSLGLWKIRFIVIIAWARNILSFLKEAFLSSSKRIFRSSWLRPCVSIITSRSRNVFFHFFISSLRSSNFYA